MDVETFQEQLKYINLNGVTLNIEEKMNIQLAFAQLKSDFKLENLYFWGKIVGKLHPKLISDWPFFPYRYRKRLFPNLYIGSPYWC